MTAMLVGWQYMCDARNCSAVIEATLDTCRANMRFMLRSMNLSSWMELQCIVMQSLVTHEPIIRIR